MKKNQIVIAGSAGVPARYGGFETLAACLCERLGPVAPSTRFAVYCSSGLYPERSRDYFGAELRYMPLRPTGWQSMLYDAVSMIHALMRRADTILLLGVSGAFILPLIRLVSNVRIVTNVDGLESRRKKWGPVARWLLRALEWCAVRFSHVVIADNEGIREHLAATYGASGALVIAYGGDHLAAEHAAADAPLEAPYALVLARIEPENNIHQILEAFEDQALQDRMTLVAIGNWDASDYGRNLRQRYGCRRGYALLDPVYDRDKVRAYRSHARCYIHGHSAGGTNPSLVEAMFFPVPIVAYECTFNRHTMEGQGAYFADATALNAWLRRLAMDGGSAETSGVMKLAAERYTWSRIAAEYARVLAAR
ncbi:MAG: DUF1972 domain-containing protein [Anaeromyxobacter sp.]